MDCLDLIGELNFNWKYKDYELRACPSCLVKLNPNDKNITIDFVKWLFDYENEEKRCISIAYFVKTKEGYDLKFVGNRPFEHVESEDLAVCWAALEMAYNLLNSWQALYQKV